MKETQANEQHQSIIGALKATAPKWEFEQIDFMLGNRGSVVEGDFYTKLKKLDVHEGKKEKNFADDVTQVCRAHNRVICVLPPAGARIFEANHRGIEGEHWAQCKHARRCREEHTLTELLDLKSKKDSSKYSFQQSY